MNGVIGAILPLAVAVTISPIPIIAEILLLFTKQRMANAGGYLAGFVAGVVLVLGALVAVAATQELSRGSGAARTASIAKVVLGVLLLVAATRQYRERPAPGETAAMPKWMNGIDSFTPGRSTVVGLVIGAVNPKNVLMALAASVIIAAGDLSTGQQATAVATYTVVAALGVAAPFVVAAVMGARAQPVLDGWKAWLGQNNATVMAVLFLVFGVVLIGQGVAGL